MYHCTCLQPHRAARQTRWTPSVGTPGVRTCQPAGTSGATPSTRSWVVRTRTEGPAPEIVAAYPHRSAVPDDLWDELLAGASDRIDVLVHAGQFLIERPDFLRTLTEKAGTGVSVRGFTFRKIDGIMPSRPIANRIRVWP